MITGKHLARRTFLRGMSTAIALPLLDAMTPAFAAATRLTTNAPRRMAFVYVPNGIIMKDWTPAGDGQRSLNFHAFSNRWSLTARS